MSYDEKKLIAFKQSILKNAQTKANSMKKDALTKKEENLKDVQEKTLEKIFIYMQEKIKNIKIFNKHKITKKSFELQREILSFRNNLIDNIYNICKENVIKFTSNPKYEEYLTKKIKIAIEENACKKVEIHLREKDLNFKEKIIDSVKNISKIKTDNENILGGFKILDVENKIEIDETFETNLKNAMKSFYKNSKLNLENF